MKAPFYVLFFAAFLMLIAGCEVLGLDTRSADEKADLIGTTWQLSSFEKADGSAVSVGEGRIYQLRLSKNDTLYVRADCNDCWASYTADKKRLSIQLSGCTRVYCGPASQDDELLRGLRDAASYRLTDATLRIAYGDGNAFHFEAAAEAQSE